MSDHPSESISFDRLADSFVARLRSGERPALSEYVDRYPEHAEDIVDLFPALAEMKCLKPDPDAPTGSFAVGGVLVHDAPNPTRLGDYRILRLIGQGGMGVVYEARRESLHAHVALKVLHRRFQAQGGFLGRFRNEARAAARLHHTNIVPVFDFGDHDGILYYVMQYIPGQGLDRVLEDVKLLRESGTSGRPAAGPSARLARSVAEGLLTGFFDPRVPVPGNLTDPTEVAPSLDPTRSAVAPPPDPTPSGSESESPGVVPTLGSDSSGSGQARYHREIARIGAQVADALAHAHSLGILHRDIKPPNLLLDARGNAWVTDFGLAKVEDGEAALTDPGDILRTLRYMAPERFSGHSDRRGDTYALGVTLYEMLALRPAFGAIDRALLVRQILNDEPTALRKLDPKLPRDLETIVRKAMAKDVVLRYASAAEMAEDLRLYLEDRPLKNARRTTPSERAYRWCRRNPMVASLCVATVALLLAVVTVSTTAAIREKKSNDALGRELVKVEIAEKKALEQLARAEESDREKSEKLWEAKLATARASRYSGRPGQRIDSFAALAQASELGRQLGHPPDRIAKIRNEAIAALALPDLQITKAFGDWTSDLVSVDLNATFELFATTDLAGRCIVRRVADDVEVARLPQASRPRSITFGGDRWLADFDTSSGATTVRIWDIAAPVPGLMVEDEKKVVSLSFRLDGGQVAILHADGSLAIHDLPGGQIRRELPLQAVPREPLIRLHPSLPYLVLTSSYSSAPRLIQWETGESAEVKLPWPEGRSHVGEWSEDGRTLVIPGPEGEGVAHYEFAGDPPVARLLRGTSGLAARSRVALNRSGDRLFSRGTNNSTAMRDSISGRILFEPLGFNALPSSPPRLKVDKERRRLFPARVDDPVRRFGYWSIAEGQESRLIPSESPGSMGRWVGITPDGRLGIGVSGQKVHLYDLDRGREAASIPFGDLGMFNFYVAFDPSGYLLTNPRGGCLRWPIRSPAAGSDTVVVGPPERLELPPRENMTSSSLDGKVIAQAVMIGSPGGWLLHPGRREPARNLHPGLSMGNAHVSPDGRWVMFAGSPGSIFVHDAETGAQVCSMPGQNGRSLFSPDGKWLATDNDNGRLYAVRTWQPGPQLGHGYLACFSPDGTLAVLSTGGGPLRLVEVASGREVARFEAANANSEQAAMSADNSRLVANHPDGLRVWDLRLIRSELSTIGLDWNAASFPPRSKPEGPLTVQVLGIDLLDHDSVASRCRRVLAALRAGGLSGLILNSADELIQSGWHGPGMAAYHLGLRRDPAMTHLRLHRGMEHFGRGAWDAVVEDFRAALAGEFPCEFRHEARIRLAWSYHEMGRPADAAATLAGDLEAPGDTRPVIEKACLRLLLAELFDLDGQPDLARREREAAASLSPNLAEAANHMAWGWITRKAGSTLGDNEQNVPFAVFLASKAVELEPRESMYGNTYGLALYRSGRYAEARSALEANLRLGIEKTFAWDLFPLAMCQQRLGDRKAARETFDRTVTWLKENPGKTMESAADLAELQAEAGRLIPSTATNLGVLPGFLEQILDGQARTPH